MSDTEARVLTDGIAVIGLAGRFPDARNVDEFWQNLVAGKESISFFSDEELLASGIDPVLLKDSNYVRARGVLGDADRFDAAFFGLSPKVAELMDPQHRVFLECAWEALEHAGYNSNTYPGRIGVYAGGSMNTYLLTNLYSHLDLVASAQGLQAAIGNDKDSLTTEVSYRLNLRGPGVTVQTSSSTSLSAVHIACQSVLNYECDMALAGGVSIHFPEKAGYLHHEGGPTSLDGHCRAFDAKAQGFVSGHGVGLVVLKRLAEALDDGDTIYAVIKGSAMNNDGSLKVSYMAPSVEGQVEVVALAQAIAGVDPETISYIECHGTATALGDPIEVAALTQVFRDRTDKKHFCALGSVKTNIGHLDSAAGVVGLLKTALALHHQLLPPSLHFESPNPQIDFENSPFYVNTQLREWHTNGHPRRAGVTSLGMGGTNAHAVLEEAPPAEPSSASRPWQLLLLSAKSSAALENATDNLAAHLKAHPDLKLADAAYTLQVGRWTFDHRRAVVCRDRAEAVTILETRDPHGMWTDMQEPHTRPLAFMFTGQGAQYPNMGRELYETEPVFRDHVDRCCDLLQPHLGLDLRSLLYPDHIDERRKTEDESHSSFVLRHSSETDHALDQTHYTQPALFVIEYALARLWMAWGLKPQAMIGHSIGEYVAACLAGVFSLEDALRLVAARGRLMQSLPPGAMLSVPLSEEELRPWLDGKLSLAANNAPGLSVVSGPADAIAELEARLVEREVKCRRLHTSHAFHSAMMDPILDAFAAEVRRVRLQPPTLPFISNLTGAWITAEEATDPAYWTRHLRQPVRFAEGLRTLLQEPERVLLEVGPGQTLSTLARQNIDRGGKQVALPVLRHPQSAQSDIAFILTTLGKLWLAGVEIDWAGFYAYERRQRVPLPTYPFERKRYWIEPKQRTTAKSTADSLGKKPDVADWFYLPTWKRTLPLSPSLTEPRRWLLFVDERGWGAALAQYLSRTQHEVILVRVGEQFDRDAEGSYTLNPQRPEDYRSLLSDLQRQGKSPQSVAHLWSLAADDGRFEQAQHLGFYSLLYLAQALGAQQGGETHLDVISAGLQPVTGEETLRSEHATLLGPCKVIAQEYPHLTCRNIDVALPFSDDWRREQLVAQLFAELTHPPSALSVAYRGAQRWIPTFEPVRLERSADSVTRLREGGVYLITGGLGGIGSVLAEYLARTVHARLALIGRSTLPAREAWGQWLETHSAQDTVSRKLRSVQALEALGADVLILSADVADPDQMRAALAQVLERFGAVHGVIHAAGAVRKDAFRAIQETGVAEAQLHFRPKLEGAAALEQALQGQALDFCLLFSSLASVLGGLGSAAYAAANIGLDHLAHRHNRNSPVRWTSINWDAWRLGDDRDRSIGATLAELALTPEEGIEVLQRIVALEPIDQLVVSTGDLAARIEQWLAPKSARSETPAAPAEPAQLHPRPNLQTAYMAPRNEIEQTLARLWQSALGVEQVGIHDNFFELGGTSLSGIQLIDQIKKAFNVHLPAVSLYEGPTVSALAKLIQPDENGAPAYEESRSRGERRRERRQRRREARAVESPEME
ncbi:MAG TPA: SDR family NAD(P)-dependent oxidoreductase [Anaerolineae bacterium]|nr:SDR family NAD(P)-dependent oxidoreductase [Anaerolineae bacterium]